MHQLRCLPTPQQLCALLLQLLSRPGMKVMALGSCKWQGEGTTPSQVQLLCTGDIAQPWASVLSCPTSPSGLLGAMSLVYVCARMCMHALGGCAHTRVLVCVCLLPTSLDFLTPSQIPLTIIWSPDVTPTDTLYLSELGFLLVYF